MYTLGTLAQRPPQTTRGHTQLSPSREQVDKENVLQQGSSGPDVSIRDPRGHESEHAVGRVGFVTTIVYALYKLCRTHGVSTGK